jgi:hypothetical protein
MEVGYSSVIVSGLPVFQTNPLGFGGEIERGT